MKQLFVFALAISFIACNDADKKDESKIEPVTDNNPLLTEEEKKSRLAIII